MPIYTYKCPSCGELYEELQSGQEDAPPCPKCGSSKGERVLSPTSSLTGRQTDGVPGHGDHGCCGGRPREKGCVPGSCCGKA